MGTLRILLQFLESFKNQESLVDLAFGREHAKGPTWLLSAFQDFIDLTIPATGRHRARYSAKNMDAGHEMDTTEEDETAPDSYVLQLWPAPAAGDLVVRQTSQTAA